MKIQNGISLTPPTPEAQAANLDKNLHEAAKMYEGHFLNEMVKSMRATVGQGDGLIKKNFGEQIFEGQLDSQYVENWSNQGGVGLADMIYEQISQRINSKGGQLPQKRVIPLSPKSEMHGIPATDSIQMKKISGEPQAALEYRLSVPHPSGGAYEAQAPLEGTVLESKKLADNWSSVKLDHGRGMTSELTFPGQGAQLEPGTQVEAGRRLGLLDSSRPVLAWKLDWT